MGSLGDGPHEFLGPKNGACPLCHQPREHWKHRGPAACDFCADLRVAWRYPTKEVTAVPGPLDKGPTMWEAATTLSDAWLACQACHELIEAGRRWPLARRAAEHFIAQRADVVLEHGEQLSLVRQVYTLHALFFAARQGPALGI